MLVLVFFSACSKVSDDDLRAAHNAVTNGALIIDVRTPEEYKVKHVKDALNIPLQIMEQYYKNIPKDKEIVVYCRSGSRSKMAAEYLQGQGRKVYDVVSQEEWEREIPPISQK